MFQSPKSSKIWPSNESEFKSTNFVFFWNNPILVEKLRKEHSGSILYKIYWNKDFSSNVNEKSFLLVCLFYTRRCVHSRSCIYSGHRQDNRTIHIVGQPVLGSSTPASVPHSLCTLTNLKVSKVSNMLQLQNFL